MFPTIIQIVNSENKKKHCIIFVSFVRYEKIKIAKNEFFKHLRKKYAQNKFKNIVHIVILPVEKRQIRLFALEIRSKK